MQISLKQSEIIAAIRGYIQDQGINLEGKTVDVAFTAGRKGAGLSADVDIYTASLVAAVTETVDVVPEVYESAPVEETPAEAETVTEEVAPAGSLFG